MSVLNSDHPSKWFLRHLTKKQKSAPHGVLTKGLAKVIRIHHLGTVDIFGPKTLNYLKLAAGAQEKCLLWGIYVHKIIRRLRVIVVEDQKRRTDRRCPPWIKRNGRMVPETQFPVRIQTKRVGLHFSHLLSFKSLSQTSQHVLRHPESEAESLLP